MKEIVSNKVKNRKRIIIILAVIFLLLIFLIVLGRKNRPVDEKSSIKEIVEYLGSTYYGDEISSEEGYKRDIYISYSSDPVTSDGNWMKYVYDNMDVVAQADAIMCGNDNLASQVVRALAEKRLAGDILVVGQDADLEACQRIVEGTQLMTVYKPVEKLAQRAAECTVQLILEDTVTGEDVQSIDDGKYTVPYVTIQPVSVSDTNLNEVIIDGGFHLKEDVYLNVPDKMPQ